MPTVGSSVNRSERDLINAPASNPPAPAKLASANTPTVATADAGAAFGRAAVPSRTAIGNMLEGLQKSCAAEERQIKAETVRNSIMYLGMNPDSKEVESKALAAKGGIVRVDQGVAMPLRTPDEIKAFVKTLDLQEPTATNVETALNVPGGKQALPAPGLPRIMAGRSRRG